MCGEHKKINKRNNKLPSGFMSWAQLLRGWDTSPAPNCLIAPIRLQQRGLCMVPLTWMGLNFYLPDHWYPDHEKIQPANRILSVALCCLLGDIHLFVFDSHQVWMYSLISVKMWEPSQLHNPNVIVTGEMIPPAPPAHQIRAVCCCSSSSSRSREGHQQHSELSQMSPTFFLYSM